MADLNFRLALPQEKDDLLAFLHTHWDVQNPFLDDSELFSYYFVAEGGQLRFAVAESEGETAALAGFIPASSGEFPDIWVSFWVASPAVQGAGLALMEALPWLVGCRHMACNNIRPKTRVFYEFLGYTAGRVGHFYRLADKAVYQLARVGLKDIFPVMGGLCLRRLPSGTALQESGFVPPVANPYKDLPYIEKRYFACPRQDYEVYGVYGPEAPAPLGLLVARTILAGGTAVWRIADFVGPQQLLPKMGVAIDALMREKGAEYADFYCVGIEAEILAKAGFCHREEDDDTNILPNYLCPPLFKNTEYYYFTTQPEGFRLCKADGDQDRPPAQG